MKKLVLFFVLCMLTAYGYAQTGPYRQIKFRANATQVQEMLKAGLSLDHVQKSGEYITGEFSKEEYAIIKRHAKSYKVLIPDMQKHYKERARKAKNKNAPKSSTAPAHFHLGSLAGFLTVTEMQAELDSMRKLFPDLITVKQSIGNTYEGNPIYMVKISDNPDVNEPTESQVLYDAMHHAREPIAMMQMLYFMWHLLENYETDSAVKYLVNQRELYFIPVFNIDGYQYNELIEPDGGGMWRKNRRPNGDGSFGVDLNRNYGYEWGYDDQGSSPQGFSETYRGTVAFSEPETRAMRDFANSKKFRTDLSYHSYGNLLIYPFGAYPGHLTDDSTTFIRYASAMTAVNGYLAGTSDQTVMYPVNGSICDWMYGDESLHTKVFSMTPEVGDPFIDGFWPDASRIEMLCEQNMEMNFLSAYYAGKHVLIDGGDVVKSGTNPVEVPVTFTSLGLDPLIKLESHLEFPNNTSISSNSDIISIDSLATLGEYPGVFHVGILTDVLEIDANIVSIYDNRKWVHPIHISYKNGSVGVSSIRKSAMDFVLSPNPASNTFQVNYTSEAPATLKLYSIEGQKLIEKQINSKEQVDISSLKPGIYYIRLETAQEISGVSPLMIRR